MKSYKMLMLILLSSVVAACGKNAQTTSTKPTVAATIFPLYDILRVVGQEHINSVLILNPGVSPHTFEIEPQEVRKISQAKAILQIGHQLDDWALKLADSGRVEKVFVVDTGIELLESDDVHDEEQNGESETVAEHENELNPTIDPHYWLSLSNAIKITNNVKDILTEIDPANQESYQASADAYIQKIETLNSSISDRISNNTQTKIITFHGGWQYFARSLDLEVAAVFEPFPGQSPTPEYVREFQRAIKNTNVEAIYTEPQLNTPTLRTIANDAGVNIKELDPIGGIAEKDSYLKLMQHNIDQVLPQ